MEEYALDLVVEPPKEYQSYFVPVPKELLEDAYKSDDFVVFVGPQHGGSGHMRLIVRVKGDFIVEVIPDPGYVHRSMEKLAETRLYIQNIPLFERPSIIDFGNYNLGYVRAIEDALEIEVPERAKYIRTILAELGRIGTHLYDAGILAVFIGHTTGFMWPFAMREFIVEIFTRITGTRITGSFIVPGGVRRDVDEKTLNMIKRMLEALEYRIKKFEKVFIKNPTTIARLREVGVLSKEDAVKYGVVGPFLRASGVEYDVRKVEPYEAYDEVDWEMVVGDDGDGYTRLLVRAEEIYQSMNIVRQLVDNIPEGDVLSDDIIAFNKKDIRGSFFEAYSNLVLPEGEYTTITEAARGTLLYTIVSDGESTTPYRVRFVTPSWMYLKGFMEACKGHRLADLQAIYGSFGYFPPEADR
ncbi:NADH dehydrogenase (quinone) [Ferroglobus placidus DSM 10642]|uniref:NADH dehydrogenase (Quinone) n=1 Tax=Ferroglobus placidus (strain DSM 10642 / AEDII12DO) TaxID=589924 RepID=D3RZE1_FERPA|nr:NADH-quinone oxidoreductase subunit D [Ferroglobus placidus]ADC65854.1 NADH dehydrogenase (quinone) [Ferroglobus placidus DSM 10642]